MEEYDNDGYASDSDDQRTIRASENLAMRRISSNRQEGRPFFNPPYDTVTSGSMDSMQGNSESKIGARGRSMPFQCSDRNIFRDFSAVKGQQPTDRCFQCGEFGHWRRFHKIIPAQQTEAAVAKEDTN